MTNKKYDYLIVGAGLTGATLAYLLSNKGYSVKVLEFRNRIGGNCYTYKEDGIIIHRYGAHIFHTSNKRIWDFVNQFAKFNNFINSPIAITEQGEVYNMPFNMNTFARMFNTPYPDKVKEIIEEEKNQAGITEPKNLEEQAISLVGTTIYNKLIKGYTEKQWGTNCKDLSPNIIKRLPIRFTYDNNYFNDIYQGIPIDGYTEMIKNMLDGIDIELDRPFKYEKDKDLAKHIIYTGRIDEFYDFKYGALDFRGLFFELKKENTSNYQGNAVFNYTGHNVNYTRTIEHKHFDLSNQQSDITYVSYEYPDKAGFPCYPIDNERNRELYSIYNNIRDYDNVTFMGRMGKYKYFDMDDTIQDCFDFIDNL